MGNQKFENKNLLVRIEDDLEDLTGYFIDLAERGIAEMEDFLSERGAFLNAIEGRESRPALPAAELGHLALEGEPQPEN